MADIQTEEIHNFVMQSQIDLQYVEDTVRTKQESITYAKKIIVISFSFVSLKGMSNGEIIECFRYSEHDSTFRKGSLSRVGLPI